MNKEIKYLDMQIERLEYRLNNPIEYHLTPTIKVRLNENNIYEEHLKTLKAIKKALLELKAIKESNPNEALEDLEVINNYGCGLNDNMKFSEVFEKEYATIKQALTTKSKKEQAFDVMKKYAVNDGWSNGWVIKFWDMSEEELELVNEVLKNE